MHQTLIRRHGTYAAQVHATSTRCIYNVWDPPQSLTVSLGFDWACHGFSFLLVSHVVARYPSDGASCAEQWAVVNLTSARKQTAGHARASATELIRRRSGVATERGSASLNPWPRAGARAPARTRVSPLISPSAESRARRSAASSISPRDRAMAATERVDDEADRRRRARELLDATTPGRSIAVRRCTLALETFRGGGGGGGGLAEARALLRDALDCSNVHHPTIYRAWISMEEQAGSDAVGIRKLFGGWHCWYRKKREGGGSQNEEETRSQDEGGFWCHYIDFELRRGTAASARGVGERAVAACPRDPAVHAKYAKAELRLGCPDRARAVLLSALDAFAADAETRERLEREVTAYGDTMRRGSWRRLRGFLPFCSRRWTRPAQGYDLLAVA
ncbi:uncharacterized protein LOC112900063 isoform X1 [Panicum hallii]|nr:uncharacterized protein LOC112900063 isoform X1 [Panicum hallii]